MHLLSILTFLSAFFSSDTDACSLGEVRYAFHQAVLDECQIDHFYQLANNIENTDDAVWLSYKAASYVLKAKVGWNPIENIKLLNAYRKQIDAAVIDDPAI